MSAPSPLLLQSLTELGREIRQAHCPTLDEVLEEYLPLPQATIFFGVAEDGLPVLLDLSNAAVGALLLLGDRGSGKTHLLRTVARALIQTKDAAQVRFTVITRRPEEWEDLCEASHCDGVFGASENRAADMLYSLAARGHADRERSVTLLFLDDLTLVQGLEYEIRLHTQWLLARGPKRKIWPVVTLASQDFFEMQSWTALMHTYLFARIADSRHMQQLGDRLSLPPEAPCGNLRPAKEYALTEGEHWLHFWIPEKGSGGLK